MITFRLSREKRRILYCSNDSNDFPLIQEQLKRHGIQAINLESYKNLKIPKNFLKILKNASVICSKWTQIVSEMFKGCSFNSVIIDDAHKIPEIYTIAGLSYGCQKLVLLGDSTEKSEFTNKIISVSKGYNISLFHRLVNQGVKRVQLIHQYFIENSIANFVNQLFQRNYYALQQQENSIELWIYGLKWPNVDSRMIFINTKGIENAVNGSLINFE